MAMFAKTGSSKTKPGSRTGSPKPGSCYVHDTNSALPRVRGQVMQTGDLAWLGPTVVLLGPTITSAQDRSSPRDARHWSCHPARNRCTGSAATPRGSALGS